MHYWTSSVIHHLHFFFVWHSFLWNNIKQNFQWWFFVIRKKFKSDCFCLFVSSVKFSMKFITTSFNSFSVILSLLATSWDDIGVVSIKSNCWSTSVIFTFFAKIIYFLISVVNITFTALRLTNNLFTFKVMIIFIIGAMYSFRPENIVNFIVWSNIKNSTLLLWIVCFTSIFRGTVWVNTSPVKS